MARPRDRLGPGLTISTLLLSALLSPAGAIPVVEGEAPRAAANDPPGGARVIPESAFTTPAPPTVFDPRAFATATVWGQAGGPDVDFYAFAGSGRVALDVDDDPFTLDLVLALFDG